MKKIYSLIAIAFSVSAWAQVNVVPNGDFESWTSIVSDLPQGFNQTSNYEAFYKCGCPANETKSTDFYHGGFALELQTQISNGDTNVGYVINTNPNGSPSTWPGGLPYSQTPTGIRGYYKSNIPAGDSGLILVNFKKSGSSIGFYTFSLYGTHSSYTLFSFPFTGLSTTPDTVQFGFTSSDFKDNIYVAGSMVRLDSVSFTGVSSQPANFDGDFENWTSTTFDRPNSWYVGGGGPNNAVSVYKTTDRFGGSFAAEMKTYLGDRCNNGNNCHPAASGGNISTGYYPNHCGGACQQFGGSPFNHQIDTLCFYYKYVPSGLDTGNTNMSFRKNGNNVMNWGAKISPASTYSYMEVAFNTMNPVDTVVISFNSSAWNDTTVNFVGSDLKVDNVYFKSQTVGIHTYDASLGIKIFPNPSVDGNFTVSNVEHFDLVRVYDVYGREVNAKVVKRNGAAEVQINTPGAYFITINARGKVTTQKIIVGKE